MARLKQSADFCAKSCPLYKRARNKGGIARWLVKNIESKVCPYCKAYEKAYQKPCYGGS